MGELLVDSYAGALVVGLGLVSDVLLMPGALKGATVEEGPDDDLWLALCTLTVDPPLLKKCAPGRSPNLGNSNWKSLPVLRAAAPGALDPPEGDRPVPLPFPLTHDKRFRYSLSSTCNLSTWARRRPFSWLADSDAFSRSSTLVSRSLRCFSLRSRKARCAARFCAFRFCETQLGPLAMNWRQKTY